MKFIFSIPGRLVGANEVKSADRSHWSRGARLRKEQLQICQYAILSANPQHIRFLGAVGITFMWFEPNAKRDIDNVSGGGQKVILDALVLCGVIPNDTRQFVKSIYHAFPDPDKSNPRIEVEVYTL